MIAGKSAFSLNATLSEYVKSVNRYSALEQEAECLRIQSELHCVYQKKEGRVRQMYEDRFALISQTELEISKQQHNAISELSKCQQKCEELEQRAADKEASSVIVLQRLEEENKRLKQELVQLTKLNELLENGSRNIPASPNKDNAGALIMETVSANTKAIASDGQQVMITPQNHPGRSYMPKNRTVVSSNLSDALNTPIRARSDSTDSSASKNVLSRTTSATPLKAASNKTIVEIVNLSGKDHKSPKASRAVVLIDSNDSFQVNASQPRKSPDKPVSSTKLKDNDKDFYPDAQSTPVSEQENSNAEPQAKSSRPQPQSSIFSSTRTLPKRKTVKLCPIKVVDPKESDNDGHRVIRKVSRMSKPLLSIGDVPKRPGIISQCLSLAKDRDVKR